jgi:polysaccharide export outer membrane protein
MRWRSLGIGEYTYSVLKIRGHMDRLTRSATLASCIAFCMTAILSAQSQGPTPESPRASQRAHYIIEPGDVLAIFVWKEPSLSGKVTVLPDGRISLGLIQDMSAAGVSSEDLAKKITEHLKQYVDFPTVTVSVESIQSYKVYVLGKVSKSGEYMSPTPINVLQALALAGGFAEFAKPAEIVIYRSDGESTRTYRFNLAEFDSGKNTIQNMALKSGDVVYVP